MNYFQGTAAPAVLSLPTPSLAPRGDDLARLITDGVLGPVLGGLRDAATNLVDSFAALAPATTVQRPQRRAKDRDDCGCSEPPPDCHCRCCIGDADLVVYARLGEVRIVPISVENRWRRERQITTELSPFTSRGGKPSTVVGQLAPPAPQFTLPPCGEQTLVLMLHAQTKTGADLVNQRERMPDVDDCEVSYADLRITGCDVRPLRIAVALLPRDCHAYPVQCRCGCC